MVGMRLFTWILAVVVSSSSVLAQETSSSFQLAKSDNPAAPSSGAVYGQQLQAVNRMIMLELKKSIEGRHKHMDHELRPLTTRDNFNDFVKRTYAPGTFAGAGIDSMKDDFRHRNSEYERGWR